MRRYYDDYEPEWLYRFRYTWDTPPWRLNCCICCDLMLVIIIVLFNTAFYSTSEVSVALSTEDRITYFNTLNESMTLSHYENEEHDFI